MLVIQTALFGGQSSKSVVKNSGLERVKKQRELRGEKSKMGNNEESEKDEIEKFLEWKGSKGEGPEAYDLKRYMSAYYSKYKDNVIRKLGEKGYDDLMKNMPYTGKEERSCIEEWLAYRTADAVWTGKRFDCDNSNTTCGLIRLIYVRLWNWGSGEQDKESQFLAPFEAEFGGDTMNSFATTFLEYMEILTGNRGILSIEKIAEGFSEKGKGYWLEKLGKESGEELWEKWNRFAGNVGCIGNFTLVPYGFNLYRYNITKDYWDASLDLLMKGFNKEIKNKVSVKWDRNYYIKFINMFFLWDYVDCEKLNKEGMPEACPLFTRKKKSELLPQANDDEKGSGKYKAFIEFLDNVNGRIERRSKFMVAMLRIAQKNSEIYKQIMENVFLSHYLYSGYGEVIEKIKELPGIKEEKEIRKILEELKQELEAEAG